MEERLLTCYRHGAQRQRNWMTHSKATVPFGQTSFQSSSPLTPRLAPNTPPLLSPAHERPRLHPNYPTSIIPRSAPEHPQNSHWSYGRGFLLCNMHPPSSILSYEHHPKKSSRASTKQPLVIQRRLLIM